MSSGKPWFQTGYFKGENSVIINRDITPYDTSAHLKINGKAGEIMRGALDAAGIDF
jgi:hypothetical protein